MSKVGSKQSIYQEIAMSRLRGRPFTIDEMREIFEEENFWTEDELADATREFKNKELRSRARKKFIDEDGILREQVNIKREESGPSEKQHFFVWTDECEKEDLEWVIVDRMNKRQFFHSEIKRFLDVYEERFGDTARAIFQRRLRLDFAD